MASFCIFALCAGFADRPLDAELMNELSVGITDNRHLMADIEAEYEFSLRSADAATKYSREGFGRMEWMRTSVRYVAQGAYRYAKSTESYQERDDAANSSHSYYGFDGMYTRTNWKGSIGNIDDRFVRPSSLVSPPNELICQEFGGHSPIDLINLSKSVREDPRCEQIARVNVIGVDEVRFQDQRCILLEMGWSAESDVGNRSRFRLWILPDRNFQTARFVSYLSAVNDQLPVAEREASDWREIAPGIWYPHHISAKVYVDAGIAKSDVSVLESDQTIDVKRVSLNPDHPESLFRDIPMPTEGVIYELRGGEIISEVVLRRPVNSGHFWWLAGGLLAAALCAAAIVVMRRRAQYGRKSISPPGSSFLAEK